MSEANKSVLLEYCVITINTDDNSYTSYNSQFSYLISFYYYHILQHIYGEATNCELSLKNCLYNNSYPPAKYRSFPQSAHLQNPKSQAGFPLKINTRPRRSSYLRVFHSVSCPLCRFSFWGWWVFFWFINYKTGHLL